MANPNPDRSGLRPFQPGHSGNPNGSSKRQRVTTALTRLLDRLEGSDDDLARTLYAMATGRRDLLKIRDPETGKLEYRRPEFAWFVLLLERLEGRVPTPSVVMTSDPDPGGLAAATREVLNAINAPEAPTQPEPPAGPQGGATRIRKPGKPTKRPRKAR